MLRRGSMTSPVDVITDNVKKNNITKLDPSRSGRTSTKIISTARRVFRAKVNLGNETRITVGVLVLHRFVQQHLPLRFQRMSPIRRLRTEDDDTSDTTSYSIVELDTALWLQRHSPRAQTPST